MSAMAMNVHGFAKCKASARKISMVTCYDYWSAQIINKTDVDCILVGDSLAMVMHGFDSTVHATIEMMAMHVSAVRRGAPSKFIIGDMPFLSCSKGLEVAMDGVQALMQAGVNSVKVEGDAHQIPIIRHIVEAGVPVMGHIGLMPQSIHGLGGHKVQGRGDKAGRLLTSAVELANAGCFGIVLECVPTEVAACISQKIDIPTIGIGAGPQADGQVLVLQDLLGANPDFKPKFLRTYADSHGVVVDALNRFHAEVVAEEFPSSKESYR